LCGRAKEQEPQTVPNKHIARVGALALSAVASLAAGVLVLPSAFAQEPAPLDPAPPGLLLEPVPGPAGKPEERLYAVRRAQDREAAERERRARERARERARAMRFPVALEGGEEPDFGEGGARFGTGRGGRAHEGQDVFAPAGTALLAASQGEVVATGSGGGRGNYLELYDERRDRTYVYFHLQSPPRVEEGERVRGGKRVGEVGCTGSCFGDHLHFEIRRGRGAQGEALDPLAMLRDWRR